MKELTPRGRAERRGGEPGALPPRRSGQAACSGLPSPPAHPQGTTPTHSCAGPQLALDSERTDNSTVAPCPPWRGDATRHGPRAGSGGQQTFLLDHGVQLLPDAVAPAGDVHVQRIVAAGLPVGPLPPPLERLCQAGLGVRHHVVHCSSTVGLRGGRGLPSCTTPPRPCTLPGISAIPGLSPQQLQGSSEEAPTTSAMCLGSSKCTYQQGSTQSLCLTALGIGPGAFTGFC